MIRAGCHLDLAHSSLNDAAAHLLNFTDDAADVDPDKVCELVRSIYHVLSLVTNLTAELRKRPADDGAGR